MADRWSCASTTGVHPRGRLCSIYRGGAPVRLGSQGLAWSPCTSWISETAPDISLTQRCGRRASAGLKPNRRVYPNGTDGHAEQGCAPPSQSHSREGLLFARTGWFRVKPQSCGTDYESSTHKITG